MMPRETLFALSVTKGGPILLRCEAEGQCFDTLRPNGLLGRRA